MCRRLLTKISTMANLVPYATDHFMRNRRMLNTGGLWMPDLKSLMSRQLFQAYRIFVLVYVHIWFTSSEFISVTETKNDLTHLIKNINFALTHLMGTFKSFYWVLRGADLRSIITMLEDEQWHYEDAEDFSPGKISRDAKRLGNVYSLGFLMLGSMTLSSSYLPQIYAVLFNPVYVMNENGTLVFAQTLPYYCWMPFAVNTRISYILALLYQAVPMLCFLWTIVGMDTLFMNIMNYIAMHLRILNGAFRTIRQRSALKLKINADNEKDSESLSRCMKHEMRKCVQHLQTVLNCCDHLEDSYNLITLGQMLSCLFILCTSLFLISTAPMGKQFAAEVIYISAIMFELVLYCWFGNRVTDCGIDIPDALWAGDWIQAAADYKSSMIMTMIRMQKPIFLTAGGFAPLTLPTFVAIVKGSYSFFAVLKKAND